MSRVVAVTGTSTEVGKTIVTAALAAAAVARGVAVTAVKPAQTGVVAGEDGDAAVVARLAGVPTREGARFRDPLAPVRAARNEGADPLRFADALALCEAAASEGAVTLVEGAGGVLVRLGLDGDRPFTVLDLAAALDAPLVVVADPALGTLNHTELTVRAARDAGVDVAGIVLGSWPAEPGLAEHANREDLPGLVGVPIVGVVPAGAGRMAGEEFRAAAPGWFDAAFVTRIVGGSIS